MWLSGGGGGANVAFGECWQDKYGFREMFGGQKSLSENVRSTNVAVGKCWQDKCGFREMLAGQKWLSGKNGWIQFT